MLGQAECTGVLLHTAERSSSRGPVVSFPLVVVFGCYTIWSSPQTCLGRYICGRSLRVNEPRRVWGAAGGGFTLLHTGRHIRCCVDGALLRTYIGGSSSGRRDGCETILTGAAAGAAVEEYT